MLMANTSATNNSLDFEEISSIYGLSFRIVAVSAFAIYAAITYFLYLGYNSWLQRKPLGLQTILDLVHRDLAFCYAMACIAPSLAYGMKLVYPYPYPHPVAMVIASFAHSRYYCLSLFLTVASIVRYIHIYHPWQLESLEKSDDFISGFIYYSVSLFSFAISSYLTSIDSNQMYFLFSHKCWSEMCPHHDRPLWYTMISVTIATNLIIKSLLWKESHINYQSPTVFDNSAKITRRKSMEFIMSAAVVILLSTTIVILLFGNGQDAIVLRLIVFFNQSVTLPLLYFISRPKMRSFFVEEVKRLLILEQMDIHSHDRSNRIHSSN